MPYLPLRAVEPTGTEHMDTADYHPDDTPWAWRTHERRAMLTGAAGGLSGATWGVFLVLASYSVKTGRANPSLYTVAAELNANVSTVRRAVRELEKGWWVFCTHKSLGGLSKRPESPNLTSTYRVLPMAEPPERPFTVARRKRRFRRSVRRA